MSQAKALRAFADFALSDDATITNLAKAVGGRGVLLLHKQARSGWWEPGMLDPAHQVNDDQPDRILS